MIEGSSKEEIENAENDRQEKENEKEKEKVISNDTKAFETKSHVGKRMKQVVQALKGSIRTSVKKRIIKRSHGSNPVSDWTYKTCVKKQNCIKNEYKSEYDSDDILCNKTRAQKEGTERTKFIPVSKISIDKGKERNANRHAAPYSATSGTMKSSNKINDDTNDCNNYGVKKQTVTPFWTPAMWKEKTEQDVAVNSTPNTTINKYREMKIVLPRNSSLLRAKKIETVEIENNNQINKPKYDKSGSEIDFQTSKSASANEQDHEAGMDFVQDRCSSSSIPPDLIGECKTLRITDTTQCLLKENFQTEDEVFTERKKGKKEVLSVEDKVLTEEANRRKNIPPAEDEVFLEEEKGTKNVFSLQEEVCIEEANRRKEGLLEGMLTYGTNKRKQVLPGRIENHKETPEIIILQEERKSITLLLTACQPNIQRMSKTMLNQTISPAASTEEKQHQFFSFVVVDLIGRVSIFRTSSLFFLCDSFVSSEKDNINLGEVWKALRDPVLQNLSIWSHGRMVKTYDSTQTDWLTKLYDGTRSSVYKYNYKFSFLFFVQFRLTSSHWQDVVKKNVQFVNPLIMTEHIRSPKKNGNTYNHPKNSNMSLIFHHNDDPGPCQRIRSQSSLQTEIVKTSLHFDANKKSEGNAMSKSPVLQAIGKLVDNDVLMKYVAYYTQKNYGRKNGIDPNCKTFEILFFDESILKKKPTRIVKTLLDFDVNKENAPVLQAMEKESEASHTGFVWLEYRAEADTEPQKYDRQNGTQIDRKTFDARPLNENTPTKTSERVKLCIVSEANDETRCMSRPIKDEGSYFIYLNSIAIYKQVTASKPTSAKLYPAPNIYQIDGKLSTVSETIDETRCMLRPMENEGSYFIYLNSIAINKQVTASKPTCAKLYPAPNLYQKDGKLSTVSETIDETRCMMRPMENEGSYFIYLNYIATNKQVTASKPSCAELYPAPNICQIDWKKVKLLDTGLNEVDVITGIEKGGSFLKNKAVPFKGGRRRVVRERKEVIAVNKGVPASKLTCAELDPAPNIYQRVGSKFNRSDDRFPACNLGPFGELRRQFARVWHWKMDFQQPSKARQFKVKSWRNSKMIKIRPPECQVEQSSVELTTARTIQGREEEGAPTKNKAEPFSEYLNAPISELHELCVLCGYRSGEHACFRSRRGSRRAFGDDSQSNDALAVNTRNLIWTQTASVLHTTQSNIPTSDQDHPSNQLLEYLNAPISELHELCVLCGHRSGEHVCFRSRVTVERPWIIDPRAFNDQNQV